MRSRLPTAVNRIATRAMTRSTAIATRSSSIGHGRATPGSTIGRKRPRRLRRRFRTHNRLAGRAHENGTNGCCGESANTNVESQENGMTAVGSEEYIAQTGIENDTIKNTEGDAQHDLHDDGLVLDSSDSVGDDQFDDETDETDEDEMDALLEKQEEVIMKLEESMVDCVFDIHGENSEDKMRQQSMSGQHFASSAGVELVCTEETEETIRSDNANICSSGSICTIKDGSVRDASESAKAQQDAHWNIIRERARSLSIDIDSK